MGAKGSKHSSGAVRMGLNSVAHKTHFTTKELLKIRARFLEVASHSKHSSLINREQLGEVLDSIGLEPASSAFIDRLYDAFDKVDNDGVNFVEFTAGLSVLLRGTQEEKLRLAFELYDMDGTKEIRKAEMVQVLKAMATSVAVESDGTVTSDNVYDDGEIVEFVDQIYATVDREGNDRLSEQEFHDAVLQFPELVRWEL